MGHLPVYYGIPVFDASHESHEQLRRQLRQQRIAAGVDVTCTTMSPAARIAPTVAPE